MKRILALLLVLTMSFSTVSVMAATADVEGSVAADLDTLTFKELVEIYEFIIVYKAVEDQNTMFDVFWDTFVDFAGDNDYSIDTARLRDPAKAMLDYMTDDTNMSVNDIRRYFGIDIQVNADGTVEYTPGTRDLLSFGAIIESDVDVILMTGVYGDEHVDRGLAILTRTFNVFRKAFDVMDNGNDYVGKEVFLSDVKTYLAPEDISVEDVLISEEFRSELIDAVGDLLIAQGVTESEATIITDMFGELTTVSEISSAIRTVLASDVLSAELRANIWTALLAEFSGDISSSAMTVVTQLAAQGIDLDSEIIAAINAAVASSADSAALQAALIDILVNGVDDGTGTGTTVTVAADYIDAILDIILEDVLQFITDELTAGYSDLHYDESLVVDTDEVDTLRDDLAAAMPGGVFDQTKLRTSFGNLADYYNNDTNIAEKVMLYTYLDKYGFINNDGATEDRPETIVTVTTTGGASSSAIVTALTIGDMTIPLAGLPMFSDLGDYQWAMNAIMVMFQYGVLNGTIEPGFTWETFTIEVYDDDGNVVEKSYTIRVPNGVSGEFDPTGDMTNAQFAAVVVRLVGDTVLTGLDNPFGEGSAIVWEDFMTMWYADELLTAIELGYLEGILGADYDPDAAISREDMAIIIGNVLEAKGLTLEVTDEGALNQFADLADLSPDAVDMMKKLVSNGVVLGSEVDGVMYLYPDNPATRAEVAVILLRLAGLVETVVYVNPDGEADDEAPTGDE